MKVRMIALAVLVLVAGPIALFAPAAAVPESLGRPVTDPAALREMTGERPLVVVLAETAGTETTDLLVPHGILQRSGAVEVVIVATAPGPVALMPALTILPDMTVAEFEARHPQGADAVIVPAFHSRGTAATTAFLRAQSALGAFVVAICEGAEPVAKAGLFEGRAATTHWFAQSRMQRHHPEARWVRNTRYLIDGPVMSSSGVSASVPAALALLELLAGTATAQRTARTLGIETWSATHDSDRFALDFEKLRVALGNLAGFWRHERLYAPVEDGIDGIAFALQADAWSRTYRSRLIAAHANGTAVTREGVTLVTQGMRSDRPLLRPASGHPFAVLDANLAAIADRYGPRTARFVASQLEYRWPGDAG